MNFTCGNSRYLNDKSYSLNVYLVEIPSFFFQTKRFLLMFTTVAPLILFYSFGFIFLLVMKPGDTWVALQNLSP